MKVIFLLSIVSFSLNAAMAAEKSEQSAAPAKKPTAGKDAYKKITKAPQKNQEDAAPVQITQDPTTGPAIAKPTVTSEPAPGAKATPPAQATPQPESASSVVSAEQSLRWLTNGNIRYVTKRLRKDGRSEADRQRLVSGQKAHAIILSCSDSRVPPELVFDQALGEIYTIRVAGEALDSSVIASVERAVEHLGPKLLVVMGHTKCETVEAAMKLKDGQSAGSESLDKVLADIRPRLRTITSETPSANLEVESTVNADGVARDLVKRSEIIRKRVEAGELVIKPALYRLENGKVSFY